jgi:hypothetical protein
MVSRIATEDAQVAEPSCATASSRSCARNVLVFLAGAEAFHTLSHMWLAVSGLLPMEIHHPTMTITQNLNVIAIVANALITAALLYGATRVAK